MRSGFEAWAQFTGARDGSVKYCALESTHNETSCNSAGVRRPSWGSPRGTGSDPQFPPARASPGLERPSAEKAQPWELFWRTASWTPSNEAFVDSLVS